MRRLTVEGYRALPLLGVAIAALIGAWPLRHGQLPWGHDAANHAYRAAALYESLREGDIYPRWWDTFFFSYGYPLLHFYAPGLYYLAALPQSLGFDVLMALNIVVTAARVVGAFGAYALAVRLLGSNLAGFVAGAAFVLAPYQLTEIYVRAALPELLAMNLLPWALWAVERVAPRATSKRIVVAAAFVAALPVIHHTTALATLGTVALFGAWRGWRALPALGATAALAALLSAFFWLPALIDAPLVRLDERIPGFPPFTGHLLPIPDVFGRTAAASYEWPEAIKVPLAELALAILCGVAVLAFGRRPARLVGAVALAAWLAVAFLMVDASAPLWDALPGAELMQYPWRLRLVGALALALLLGAVATLPRAGVVLGLAAVVALGSAALIDLRPRFLDVRPESINAAGFARYELNRTFPEVGTTVPAQLLPRAVALRSDEIGVSMARTPAPGTPPLAARVAVLGDSAGELRLVVESAEPFTLKLHQFHFAGWRGWLDGASLPLRAEGPRGLVAANLPAGRHDMRLRSDGATYWSFPGWLSALAAGREAQARATNLAVSDELSIVGWSASAHPDAIDIGLYWLVRRDIASDYEVAIVLRDALGREALRYRRPPNWGSTPTSTWSAGELVRDRHRIAVNGLPAGGYVLQVGIANRPLHQLGGVVVPSTRLAAEPPRALFAGGLALVDATTPEQHRLSPGGRVDVSLLWRADIEPTADYATAILLADRHGRKHGEQASYPPHDLAFTAAWDRGRHHRQQFAVPVAADLPTGVYDLSLELFDYQTGARSTFAAGVGRLPLKRYSVVAAPTGAEPSGPGAQFADGIALVAYDARVVDGRVELDLRWGATAAPSRDYTIYLHVNDASGRLLAQADSPPLDGDLPTSFWLAGDTLDERRRVDWQPGAAVKIGLYDPTTGERLPTSDGRDGITIPIGG